MTFGGKMKKNYKYLMTILLLLGVLASCAYTQKISDQILTISDKVFPNGDFNSQVVKGDSAMESGNYGKAIAAYEEAGKLKPADWDLKLKLARAYELDGKLGQAFNVYQVIIDSSKGKNKSDKAIATAQANQSKLGFGKEPLVADAKPASAIRIYAKVAVAETLADSKRPIEISSKPEEIVVEKSAALIKPAPANLPAAKEKIVSPVIAEKPLQPDNVKPQENSDHEAIHAALEGWRLAWINQDWDGYVKHYGKSFKGDAKTRKAWLKQRKDKIKHGKSIKLELTNINIKNVEKDKFDVEFTQNYQSANYNDKGTKVLTFKHEKNLWIIIHETFKR